MTPEILTTIGVGVALAAIILPGQRALRSDMSQLHERMMHLEGLLEGLREVVARDQNRAA